jgi:hypothetical protein
MISSRDVAIATIIICPNCNRVFDMFDEEQSQEWTYGHDCFLEDENND